MQTAILKEENLKEEGDACCEHCAEKTNFSHGDDDERNEDGAGARAKRLCAFAGAAIFAAGMGFNIAGVLWFSGALSFAWFLAAYLLVGWQVLLGALRGVLRGKMLDENFLMAVASIGAFAISEYPEGVAVMLFYRIGEYFEDRAVDKSKRAITELMKVRPEYANLLTGETTREVAPEEVMPGDFIIVKPGERVPLDGVVAYGRSSLDASALTGESVPADVEPGDEALAGAVNTSGLLKIEVTKPAGESAVMKILQLVREASARKAPAENFITKFARIYTPAVVIAAICLALIPPLFIAFTSGGGAEALPALFSDWVSRALVFLVISCPCALVISIPLSYFGGLGGASKNGVLIKGGNYLEALSRAKIVVFDKTGTLTRGKLRVTSVFPADGISENETLRMAALTEKNSSHPIAKAIMEAARQRQAAENSPDSAAFTALFSEDDDVFYEELAGKGVRATAGAWVSLAGKAAWLREYGAAVSEPDGAGTAVYLAAGELSADGKAELKFIGAVVLSDELKPDAREAVTSLYGCGVRQIAMLSGDTEKTVRDVASKIGIEDCRAELLPGGKVEAIEALMAQDARADGGDKKRGTLVFVGDGINDAPVLSRADVGVAMGGVGSDAAVEAADIVLLTDEPSKLASAIRIAKRTRAIALQNIIFALGVKGALLILGAAGLATMWAAVFGDVGVALIAILNALRALQTPKRS